MFIPGHKGQEQFGPQVQEISDVIPYLEISLSGIHKQKRINIFSTIQNSKSIILQITKQHMGSTVPLEEQHKFSSPFCLKEILTNFLNFIYGNGRENEEIAWEFFEENGKEAILESYYLLEHHTMSYSVEVHTIFLGLWALPTYFQ